MTKHKRFYYNTFYHANDMSRVLNYEIIDRQSYPNYPNHDEKEDIPDWYIYITENDSGWQDMLINLLNQLNDENEQLRQYIKNNYIGSVCDNCEYCKEIHTNDWFNGIIHDAECEKGHIDMDISDCEDFKLTSKVFKND